MINFTVVVSLYMYYVFVVSEGLPSMHDILHYTDVGLRMHKLHLMAMYGVIHQDNQKSFLDLSGLWRDD